MLAVSSTRRPAWLEGRGESLDDCDGGPVLTGLTDLSGSRDEVVAAVS
jgi:hypothetical protein